MGANDNKEKESEMSVATLHPEGVNVEVEGDVIEVFDRRRDRNSARTPEVLPPDVDTKVMAISRLDSPELQARAITTMVNHARTGLLAAIAAQDLPQIVEFKQKAAAIQEIAKQVRLGKEVQLDAAEFVRRAERGLGVAIREGQNSGDVRRTGQKVNMANQHGKVEDHRLTGSINSPTDFAPASELSGARSDGIYAMTDGVSDEAFEAALAEARAEENLTRANVARKAKAKAGKREATDENDPLIDADVEPAPRTQGPRPFRKTDTEMLAEIVGSLANFAELIRYINADAIDRSTAVRLADQGGSAIRLIRKTLKEIRNVQA